MYYRLRGSEPQSRYQTPRARLGRRVDRNIDELTRRVSEAQANKEIVSIAYIGNVIEVWEEFAAKGIFIHLGSDQTSLHNPWSGGYYPAGLSYDEANQLLREKPDEFKEKVEESIRRHAAAVNLHTEKGTYFFDYGNAFLLEASRAGADVMAENKIEFPLPFLRSGYFGTDVFRLRFRSLPLGMCFR